MTDYEKAIAYSLFEIARDGRLLTFDPLNNLYNVSIYEDEHERNDSSIEYRYRPLLIRRIDSWQREQIVKSELDYESKLQKNGTSENVVYNYVSRE